MFFIFKWFYDFYESIGPMFRILYENKLLRIKSRIYQQNEQWNKSDR